MSKPSSILNAPSRHELFELEIGEEQLTVVEDTKIPNAATITINKEDHTLANMLRSQLLLLPYILFAGYKIPHPLEPVCVLKVQTTGEKTPVEAVHQACDNLVLQLSKLKAQMIEEVERERARQVAASRDMDGYGPAY